MDAENSTSYSGFFRSFRPSSEGNLLVLDASSRRCAIQLSGVNCAVVGVLCVRLRNLRNLRQLLDRRMKSFIPKRSALRERGRESQSEIDDD
jgi:hypothetical protein